MPRVRLNRRKASKSPTVPRRTTQTDRAVQRLIAAETARLRPSDEDLEKLSEISPEDVTVAVKEWDTAQADAGTGLEGLLDAKLE